MRKGGVSRPFPFGRQLSEAMRHLMPEFAFALESAPYEVVGLMVTAQEE